MIDRATVDKIMDAVNIVDVVGEFVNLRKAGVNYKGLCPFHDDKTPSFMVSPARQICKCFACGEGGNAVNFLMKHEQITYPEALRWLAKKYNIEIQERELSDDEKREQSERESMFVVNEWACQYFHTILKNDVDGQAIGRQYFRSRGIRDDIIEKFQLGFALSKRDALANEARRKGFKEDFLIKTGLCYLREANSQLIDRFAGRAIFPWLNVSGKVVAFGGRKLDAATKGVQQKYVNSPDSEIYHKERELYGIYQAKKAIVKEDCVYMVEGYTDVIAMHQCGIENVVANSGTALSTYQVRLLHRFTQNIVLLYDGDEAGIHAAMRGTDMLLQEGMNIKVLLLPDGDDPDSFARKHTATDFRQYIADHQTDFIQFKTDLLLKGVTDPQKRSEAISSILRSVSVIPDKLKRDTYLSDCSHRFSINEQALVTTVNTYIQKDKEERQKERERALSADMPASAPGLPARQELIMPIGLHSTQEQTSLVERMLIQNVIRHGDEVIFEGLETEDGSTVDLTVAQYIDFDLSSDELSFSDERYNRILAEAVAHSGETGFKADQYFMKHPDPDISRLAATLAIDSHQLSRSFEMKDSSGSLRQRIQHLILDFRMDLVNQHLKNLQRQLKEAGGDMLRIRQLMDEYKGTQELRNALARQRGSDVIV